MPKHANKALALAGRAEAEIAQMEPALRASRDRLQQREQSGAPAEEAEKLRRTLQEEERHATQLLHLAEKKQAEAAAASAELQNTEAFLRCPHCDRVLFNPDWSERP
jgi:rubrerythrin